jgi:acyl carrier protein
MDREYIEQKVIEIIREIMNEDLDISMDSNFVEDLDILSIEVFSMISEVEDEFDIKIPEKVATKFTVVGDLVDYISDNIG